MSEHEKVAPVVAPPSRLAIIDAYEASLRAAREARSAAIDAAACGTSRDWDRVHDAQDRESEADEAFRRLLRLLRRAIK